MTFNPNFLFELIYYKLSENL